MKVKFSNIANNDVDECYEYYLTKASREVADRFEIELENKIRYMEKFF